MSSTTLPQNITNGKPVDLSARLAFDLAAKLYDLPEILERYAMTEAQLKDLLRTPAFAAMVKEAHQTWSSGLNSAERIQVKSRIALEELVPEIYGIGANEKMVPAARLEASKILSKLSGFDNRSAAAEEAGTGKGFSITINIGNEPVVIEGAAEEIQDAQGG